MRTFKTSREISALPETIFGAFSDPERMSKWWGPAGFTNTFNLFQFISGGKWSFVMHGPDGSNYPNENEFVQIVPNESVVIRHHSEPHFTLTIIMVSTAKGSLVQWIQEFDNDELARNIAHIIEPSNEENLDRLAAEVCSN